MDNSARVFWQVCSFPLLTIPLSFVLSPDRNFIKNYAFLEVHGHKDLHFFVFAWNDAEHQIALASKTLWFHDQKYIILIIGLIIYVDWGQWEENGRSRSNFLLFSHNFFFLLQSLASIMTTMVLFYVSIYMWASLSYANVVFML